ncbi:MAG TPA: DUF1540 domain-containing protein [Longimicrobiales bacterium]
MATPHERPRAAASIVASCSATDCTYNENRECHAGEIDVRLEPQGAVCATYEPEAPPARP